MQQARAQQGQRSRPSKLPAASSSRHQLPSPCIAAAAYVYPSSMRPAQGPAQGLEPGASLAGFVYARPDQNQQALCSG